MCTLAGYCREHGISHEVWDDEPMTCERAQEIRARLTAASPTAAEFWADEPAGHAPGDATRGQESRSGPETSGCTPDVCEAGRIAHSDSGLPAEVRDVAREVRQRLRLYGQQPPSPYPVRETAPFLRPAVDACLIKVRPVPFTPDPALVRNTEGNQRVAAKDRAAARAALERTYNEGARRD